MSSVRTRAGGRSVPGKRIPPPPSFSPPALPDTDNFLTVYSRNRSANSSRSVSPVPNITESELVTDTQTCVKNVAANIETNQQTVDIRFTNQTVKENPQVSEMKIETADMGTEKKNDTTCNNVDQTTETIKESNVVEMKLHKKRSDVVKSKEPKADTTGSLAKQLTEEVTTRQVTTYQAPEMRIEPPSPVTEKRNNAKQDGMRESNVAPKKPSPKESEVVQTQVSSQHGQHNFDGSDREEMKRQETDLLTEKEQTSLYEKFPLQEEKQIKHKLKRRVSKKSSKTKSENAVDTTNQTENDNERCVKENINVSNSIEAADTSSDFSIRQKNLSQENSEIVKIQKLKQTEEVTPNKSEPQISKRIQKSLSEVTESSANISLETVSGNKCQATSIELPNVASDPAFTSDGVKVRMHGDKQHERPPGKHSDKSDINIENDKNYIPKVNDPDDIVQEILGSCSQVNKILSRIMDDKVEADEEEDPHNIKENDHNNKEDQVSLTLEETPVDLPENIADLTVDKVKEYLLMEEQANNILKKELEDTKKKKEQIERAKSKEPKVAKQQNGKESLTKDTSDTLKHPNISSSKRGLNSSSQPKKESDKNIKSPFKSKKEQQISKIKDFLRDPNSPATEDVQLDVRFKQTEAEREESSKEITKILDHLFIASYSAVKDNQTSVEGISAAIEISNSPNLKSFPDVLHIIYSDENVMLKTIFSKIADKVENIRKNGGKILITCEQSTGVSAAMCIPYLIKYAKMSTREAMKMMEKKRKQAKPHSGIIIRLEEWEARQSEWSVSGGLTSIVASWLPLVFIIILGYLLFKKIFDVVENDHMMEKRTDADFYTKLYEYFDVRNWP